MTATDIARLRRRLRAAERFCKRYYLRPWKSYNGEIIDSIALTAPFDIEQEAMVWKAWKKLAEEDKK